MLQAMWSVMLDLAPWLLLGAAVSAAMHVVLPPGLLRQQLSGYSGVVKAVVLGVPLPLCSCGVIPAGLGLKKDGAGDGASVGFLISTPQTGVDSVLVAASFLGWPFALFKVGAAALTGLVGGALAEAVAVVPDSVDTTTAMVDTGPRTWRDGLNHGLELVEMIWGWLLFGVIVSAALTVWIPQGSLAGTVLGSGPLSVLAVLLLSVPLYVCATASVPIAAGLVAAGLPTGAALVFLMAGPATNVATIGAVYRAFGRRITAVYLGTVILGSVGLGLAFDALWGATASQAIHHHHSSGLATVAAILLLSLIGYFASRDAMRWWQRRGESVDDALIVDLTVEGMSCGGCSSKLDGALRGVSGVTRVEVSHEDDHARVWGTAERDRVMDTIRQTGFRPIEAG